MARRLLLGVLVVSLLGMSAPAVAAGPVGAGVAGHGAAVAECDGMRLVRRGDPEPVASGACPGVRPGAYVESEDVSGSRSGCTFNFVWDGFTRGADPVGLGRYIGTAGHCVLTAGGTRTWSNGAGPRAFDSTGRHIGHYVFAVQQGRRDFGLLKLLPGIKSDPQMCHWGGPTGLLAGTPTETIELKHFGQGTGFGATFPARTAIAADGLPNPDEARAWGAVVFGDSGSGIIAADGRAVGVIVTVGFGVTAGGNGTVGITRLAPQVAMAEDAVGINLRLVTAPRMP